MEEIDFTYIGMLIATVVVIMIFLVAGWIVLPEYGILKRRAMKKELPSNIQGIVTAELGYDAAFDKFVPCSSRSAAVKAVQFNKQPKVWKEERCWRELGWRPDGMVRGAYWVEVAQNQSSGTVYGVMDLDEDGVMAEFSMDFGQLSTGTVAQLSGADVE